MAEPTRRNEPARVRSEEMAGRSERDRHLVGDRGRSAAFAETPPLQTAQVADGPRLR